MPIHKLEIIGWKLPRLDVSFAAELLSLALVFVLVPSNTLQPPSWGRGIEWTLIWGLSGQRPSGQLIPGNNRRDTKVRLKPEVDGWLNLECTLFCWIIWTSFSMYVIFFHGKTALITAVSLIRHWMVTWCAGSPGQQMGCSLGFLEQFCWSPGGRVFPVAPGALRSRDVQEGWHRMGTNKGVLSLPMSHKRRRVVLATESRTLAGN